MTDVTEEEETELKKPLPRKDAKSVEKPDPHQKQQEDYDKEIVKGKKAAAVKQQVEEDDDDDETEDEEDETKDEEDETEDEEEETEDETEAVGKDDAESDEELESEEDEEVEDTSPKGTVSDKNLCYRVRIVKFTTYLTFVMWKLPINKRIEVKFVESKVN